MLTNIEENKASIFSSFKSLNSGSDGSKANLKSQIGRRLVYILTLCSSFSNKFSVFLDLLLKELGQEKVNMALTIEEDGVDKVWLLVKDLRIRKSKYAVSIESVPKFTFLEQIGYGTFDGEELWRYH